MGLLDSLAIATLPLVPTPIMRRLSSRYIAGERLDQAIDRLRTLAQQRFPGVLDLLGEGVEDEAAARQVAADYIEGAQELRRAGLDAYISIKPTHLGLTLSEELAFELYAQVAEALQPHGEFVRVEMEDHPTTDATLRVFARLRERFDNVGIVLQARLFRTPQDIAKLPPGPLNVRMVKGIYLEPESIAHTEPEPIRTAYVECSRLLLERGDFVAFATHDDVLAERCLREVRARELGSDRYEFQVLLGVQEPLWSHWRDAGHPVRVYVPYGPDWRAYSQRRLRKNPQIFWHVTRDLFGLGKKKRYQPA